MKSIGVVGISLLAALSFVSPAGSADVPPIYVVVFTHVEDNTPGGVLGSVQSRQNYLLHRTNLIAMADLALGSGMPWTLQPDWKLLEAALLYEDSTLRATTNGKNFLRFLKEDRAVVIDPHSHENGGYNYTDVAHLLDSLGVGATTVIGGHIWDPALPQFQEWDRFRVPVAGEHYPGALWRGDILIGSGTPNHVNDPVVSGAWRPRDRDHYFEHDPLGNITAIGAWKKSIPSIAELIALYRTSVVPPNAMLTFSCNIGPSTLAAPGGLASVADTVIAPLVAWRDSGLVVITDFTSLVGTWETAYAALGYLYDGAAAAVSVSDGPVPAVAIAIAPNVPNPAVGSTVLRYSLGRETRVRLAILDLAGREVAVLVEGWEAAGEHAVRWDAARVASGAYFSRLEVVPVKPGASAATRTRKIVVIH